MGQASGASSATAATVIGVDDDDHGTARAPSRPPGVARTTLVRPTQADVIDVYLDTNALGWLAADRDAEAERQRLHDIIDQQKQLLDTLDQSSSRAAIQTQHDEMALLEPSRRSQDHPDHNLVTAR